jgi:hypothetical protein
MIVRLQDNPNIIVRPDYSPVTATQVTGSGSATVTQSGTNPIVYDVFVPSGGTVQWTDIAGKPDLWTTGETQTAINTATTDMWTSGETINYVTGYTPTLQWGNITGALSGQTDLQLALDGKAALIHYHPQYLTGYTVTAQDVTGITSSLYASKSAINTLTGTTLPATYTSKSAINTLTGTTLPATYTSKSAINTYTGTTAPNQFAEKIHVHPQYLTGVTWTEVTDKPDLDFLPLSGGTITGTVQGTSLQLSGDLTVDGTMNIVHVEEIYSEKDFMFTRSGNTSGLGVGQISGIGIMNADGTGTTVVLGADRNGIMRVGWSGDTLVALAGREDSPLDGGYAIWNNTLHRFDTTDLQGRISTYTGTTAPAIFASKTSINTYTGTTAPATYFPISGYSFIESGSTQIAVAGNQVTIYAPAGGTGGSSALSGLTDVSITSVASNNFLVYSGTTWVNQAPVDIFGNVTDGYLLARNDTSITGVTQSKFATVLATIKTVTGTTYTALAADSGKILEFTNTGATTITLVTGLTTGYQIAITNYSASVKTFAAGTGVTIRSKSGNLKLSTIYNMASAYYRGSGIWVLAGDLTST